MKIGIMSMQRIVNYGSFLQAYGLKMTIQDLGHEVQFVDYKVEHEWMDEQQDFSEKYPFFHVIKRAIRMSSRTYRAWRTSQKKMNQSFDSFAKTFKRDFLPFLGVENEPNLSPDVDTLVIGSDEVFNCTQSGNEVGYSKQLFGYGRQAKRLISYGASFGNTTLNKLQNYGIDTEIAVYLSDFDSISVRDDHSYNIIKLLTGITAYKHIDPVLVYPFEEADEIKIPIRDYIIVYAYAGRIKEEEASAIRDFARKQGKKIVTLGFYQPFCDQWIPATPFEVLAYIKHADFVITDTFHGTVFSIKYQKRFGTLIRESNAQKVGDLLRRFQLENHQIKDLSKLTEIVETSMDNNMIKKIVAREKKAAIEYLKREL